MAKTKQKPSGQTKSGSGGGGGGGAKSQKSGGAAKARAASGGGGGGGNGAGKAAGRGASARKSSGGGGSPAGGSQGTSTLRKDVIATIKRMEKADPGIRKFLENSYGYVVFPHVGKAALVVGGAYGRGEVFEEGEPVGFATIGQLTIGVQLGGDTFSEIIAFETKQVMDRFKAGRFGFAANASAVLVKAGAAATANYEKGAAAFTMTEGGMMLELAIGGQKFKFKPSGGGEEAGGESGAGEDEGGEGGEGGSMAGLSSRVAGGAQAVLGGARTALEGARKAAGSVGTGARKAAGSVGNAAGQAKELARQHPIAATLVGVGAAAAAAAALRGTSLPSILGKAGGKLAAGRFAGGAAKKAAGKAGGAGKSTASKGRSKGGRGR